MAKVATAGVPATPTVTLPLAATTTLLVPFVIDAPPLAVIPVNADPLPNIKPPAILPVVLTLLPVTLAMAICPPAEINPPVRILPPVTLPVVDTGLLPNAAKLATTLALP